MYEHQTDISIGIYASFLETVQCGLFLPTSQRSRAWSAELFMTGRNSELSSRPRLCLRVSRSLCCNIPLSQSSSTSFICHRENVSLSSPCSKAFTTLKGHTDKHKRTQCCVIVKMNICKLSQKMGEKKSKILSVLQPNHKVTTTFCSSCTTKYNAMVSECNFKYYNYTSQATKD